MRYLVLLLAALPSVAAAMPNPASVNCVNRGGKLEIRKGKGGEYGVCIFTANRQCEEWALFRGECPAGGVDISSCATEGELQCAMSGGEMRGRECVYPVWNGCALLLGDYKDKDSSSVKFLAGGRGDWNGKRFTCAVAIGGKRCGTVKFEGDAPLFGKLAFTKTGDGLKFYPAQSDCSGKPLRVLRPAGNTKRKGRPAARFSGRR